MELNDSNLLPAEIMLLSNVLNVVDEYDKRTSNVYSIHNVFIFIGEFKNDEFSSEALKCYADAGTFSEQ